MNVHTILALILITILICGSIYIYRRDKKIDTEHQLSRDKRYKECDLLYSYIRKQAETEFSIRKDNIRNRLNLSKESEVEFVFHALNLNIKQHICCDVEMSFIEKYGNSVTELNGETRAKELNDFKKKYGDM